MRKTLEPKIKPRLPLDADPGTEAIVGQGLPQLHPYTQVPLDWIEADPEQPRQYFDEEKLEQLAADLKLHGIDHPLFVRTQKPNRYTLIAGERRLRAARRAGLRTVPVLVRDDLGPAEANLLRLRENLQREDLTPLEVARGLQQYKEMTGATWETVAAEFGRTKKSILEIVGLLRAPEKVQELLELRRISPAHATVLAPLPPERQVPLAERAASDGLTVRELREARETMESQTSESPVTHVDVNDNTSGTPLSVADEQEWSHFKVTPEETVDRVVGNLPASTTPAAPEVSGRPEGAERSHFKVTPQPPAGPMGQRKGETALKELRVTVDAEQHRKLRHMAADTTGGSVAALVREALVWMTERFDSGESIPWKTPNLPQE